VRSQAVALGLILGILASGSNGAAWAQPADDACPRPILHPERDLFPGQARRGSGRLQPETDSLFISPSGHLCRTFSIEPAEIASFQVATDRAPEPGRAFLLSSALPGVGQWYLGQQRWPAYLAVEVWAWIQFLDWRREGRRLQAQYRDLAWLVARRVSTGRRTDAGWDYYEALVQFRASGAYDADPNRAGIQPEDDSETFNGYVWGLAQEIFLPQDPEIPVEEGSESYQKAFQYYESRAYAPALAWDWGTNNLHREEYATLIREADEALRSSTGMVGVILANHLLSAVDALVSGRLGIAGRSEPSLELRLVPGPFCRSQIAISARIPSPFAHDR
jgi:hypothetical protein